MEVSRDKRRKLENENHKSNGWARGLINIFPNHRTHILIKGQQREKERVDYPFKSNIPCQIAATLVTFHGS